MHWDSDYGEREKKPFVSRQIIFPVISCFRHNQWNGLIVKAYMPEIRGELPPADSHASYHRPPPFVNRDVLTRKREKIDGCTASKTLPDTIYRIHCTTLFIPAANNSLEKTESLFDTDFWFNRRTKKSISGRHQLTTGGGPLSLNSIIPKCNTMSHNL